MLVALIDVGVLDQAGERREAGAGGEHQQALAGQRLSVISVPTALRPTRMVSPSLIADPHVYERYEHVVLVHGCRQVSELAYGDCLVAKLAEDELFGELMKDKFTY